MNPLEEERNHINLLRRRAEEALRGLPVELDDLQTDDIQYLLHELQVHQAELSIQNDELRHIQQELETSRNLYSDLYNFSPAGYCTLDQKDFILETNQTLAAMLGVRQEKLIHMKLSNFVDRADQDEYYLHRRRAFEDHQRQISKIRMVKQTGEKIDVRLESVTAHENGNRLRTMLSDITEQQRIEKEAAEAVLLRELRHRVADQREQERQQVARDLHDGPIQEMIAMTFVLHGMLMDHPTSEMVPQLEEFQTNLKKQISVLRSYAMELRPPTLSSFGLEKTLLSHAAIFQEKNPNIRIQLEMHQTGPLLTETTSLALFRIYQEALTNVQKHCGGADIQVLVRLEKDEYRLQLEILDNGQGFDLPRQWNDLVHEGHLGLVGMRERVEGLGGQIEIYSKKGQGTRVGVTLRLDKDMLQPPSG